MPSEQPAKYDSGELDSISPVDREFNKIEGALERLETSIESLGKRVIPVRTGESKAENPGPPLLEDISGTSTITRRLGDIYNRIEQYKGRVDYVASELEI